MLCAGKCIEVNFRQTVGDDDRKCAHFPPAKNDVRQIGVVEMQIFEDERLRVAPFRRLMLFYIMKIMRIIYLLKPTA